MQYVFFARYQSNPKKSHEKDVKSIFRYLKGTLGYGLWYIRDHDYSLKAYIDVDWAKFVDDRRSISGSAFLFRDILVSWFSKKHDSISLSITKAKYIIAASCCTQVLWSKKTLKDIKVQYMMNLFISCVIIQVL